MARPALRHDAVEQQRDAAAPRLADASAETTSEARYGPVADLHRELAARLSGDPGGFGDMLPERSGERLIRHTSRAGGWLLLTAGFLATIHFIA